MPVLTHDTHASVIKTNPRYGCNSRPAFIEVFAARDGYYGDAYSGIGIRWTPIKHTMSTGCRYDGQDTDPGCAGCTAEKDAEYVNLIRKEGRKGMNKDNRPPGLYKTEQPRVCTALEHFPPMHLYIPPGSEYQHVCPACGYRVTLRSMEIYCGTAVEGT